MAETESPEPLHPDLMPSLRKLVRGLEVLFWALLVCVQETMVSWWESWGIAPALAAMVLLWYGTYSLGHFQKQERVWQGTVNFAQVLALLMVGLVPFLHWQQQITSDTMTWSQMSEAQKHVVYSACIFFTAGMMYVLNLNHVLARLAAMLPDPILRADVRLFVYLNFGLFLLLVIGLWMHQKADVVFLGLREFAPAFAESIGSYLGLAAMMKAAILWAATLVVTLTMTMLWKTKEAILKSVFSLEPPPLPEAAAADEVDPSLN
jgi:hypothetical protein